MRTLDDISLSETDRAAITRAAAILKAGFPVTRVILYGSKARGDDAADSDIDLLVLTSRPVAYLEKGEMTRAVYPIELDLGVPITLLVRHEEKWEQGLNPMMPIYAEVERDGVVA